MAVRKAARKVTAASKRPTTKKQPATRKKRSRKASVPDSEKSAVARAMWQGIFGMEVPQAFDLEDVQEAVNRSLWLAVSVQRLATAISNIAFKVIRTDTRDEATGTKARRVRQIMRRPRLDETYQDLIEQNMWHLGLTGESYMEIVRDGLNEVAELWTWNPRKVTPKPDTTGKRLISSYVFRVGSGERVVPADEVIAVRSYNPNSPLRGMSMVSPMWQDILGDQAAARMNKAHLQRGGRISGVLSPKDGSLGDDEFRKMQDQVRSDHHGPENAGKFMVLPAWLEFTAASHSPKDMDFLNLRKFAREIAAGGMGIPPMVIGNFDSATYANAKEQLRGFWDYTAKPWLTKILGAITEQWIRTEVDENLELAADLAQIDALVDNQTARTTNVSSLLQGGVITINEARQEIGKPPLPDGDRLLIPLNLTPVDPTEIEPPEPEPQEPPPPPDDDEEEEDREEGVPLGHRLEKARDRDTARAAHEHQLLKAERKLAGRVRTYLKGARTRFIERLRVQADGAVDLDFVVGNKEIESHQAAEELAPAIVETVQDAGELTLSRLGLDKVAEGRFRRKLETPERMPELMEILGAFDMGNPRILAYLERFFLTHLEDLTDRTLDQLRTELKDGLDMGEGVNQLVLRIQKLPALDALRAEKIARTETIGAFNLGAQEAFRAAGTPMKSWIVTADERTRASHRAADSTYRANPIPVTDKFVLTEGRRGSAELAFPGDPEAPAWAVVNCRCAMLPEDEAELACWIEHCKAELEEVMA